MSTFSLEPGPLSSPSQLAESASLCSCSLPIPFCLGVLVTVEARCLIICSPPHWTSLYKAGLHLDMLMSKEVMEEERKKVKVAEASSIFTQPKTWDCFCCWVSWRCPAFLCSSAWLPVAPCSPDTDNSQQAPGSLRACLWDRKQTLPSSGGQRRRQVLMGGTSWPKEKRSWQMHFCHQGA